MPVRRAGRIGRHSHRRTCRLSAGALVAARCAVMFPSHSDDVAGVHLAGEAFSARRGERMGQPLRLHASMPRDPSIPRPSPAHAVLALVPGRFGPRFRVRGLRGNPALAGWLERNVPVSAGVHLTASPDSGIVRFDVRHAPNVPLHAELGATLERARGDYGLHGSPARAAPESDGRVRSQTPIRKGALPRPSESRRPRAAAAANAGIGPDSPSPFIVIQSLAFPDRFQVGDPATHFCGGLFEFCG